ncbi:MAG: mannose-6-phosphate isomerase, class I [Acidimicrobiia bacterium]|nr:mannose-6-phosphate isomerase, class I [Acidimicrobiia bacterium]
MVGLRPLPLRGRVQHYDWGSPTAIPELLGQPPDGQPWAELWLGAHPAAPADVLVGGAWLPLDGVIAADPAPLLGPACLDHFGPHLPFLVKVLAAARPLSLQVHPSPAQAVEGFAREEAAGIPRHAPDRTYRDPWHKPELLCARTPFRALSGFRGAEEAADVLDAFGLDQLAKRARADGLAAAFWALWDVPPRHRGRLVDAAAEAAAARPSGLAAEADLVARLAALHPEDVGVVAALLLNLVLLAPGEAIYARAGRLHAYVEGVGVEIMATSDNVVRGGLTSKHVHVEELRRILRVEPEEVVPQAETADGWPTPAPEFHLSRLAPGERAEVHGPEVLLSLDGPAEVAGARVEHGGALFVPAALGAYDVDSGAPLYRCRAGLVAQEQLPGRRP